MRRPDHSENRKLRAVAAIAILLLASVDLAASPSPGQVTVDLHPYGFPSSVDIKLGVFYLSQDRIALFFDKNDQGADPHSHAFQLMLINTEGQVISQLVVRGDPRAMDITVGPSGGVLFRNQGQLRFYDGTLQLLRSEPVSSATSGIKFYRERNQLVLVTADQDLGHRTAHFLNGRTLEESATLTYPLRSVAVFGENQLVYIVSGYCTGAAHIVSSQPKWRSLDALPACDPLAFITSDTLAYASAGTLYIVDSNGKQLFEAGIPAADSFETPRFVGLSDDHTRLAISALRRKFFSSGWPYYDEVYAYDLASKRRIFKHALPRGSDNAMALSTDGHQMATIEQGILMLTSIP
jgi:hypothetical protein